MSKITLLGDSIRLIGYGEKVAAALTAEGHEVFQPTDNCRFSKYTLRGLFDWADGIKNSDVIHWNNGLWDATEIFDDGIFTPENEYVENMVRIAKHLKAITPNVIFATTTPVKDVYKYTHNDKIDRFNEIIVPILKEMGIEINDLNSLLRHDTEKYICEDEIHLSEAGKEVCSAQVLKAIKKYL